MANIVDIVIKGTDKSKKALTASIKNTKDLATAAKTLGPAFAVAVGAAVTAIGVLVFKSIQAAEELQKTADKLGVTVEALSTLSFAANIAGTDVAIVEKAMKRLSVQVLDAGRGLKEAQDNFKDLGIEVKNQDGSLKGTEQLFKEVADSISQLPDGLQKAGLAQKVFGKSGAELIPLLNQGAGGIEQLQQKARALGLEFSTNTGRSAEQLIDNITILKGAFTGAFNVIAKDLLPGLVALTGEFTGAADGPVKMADGIKALTETIVFFGKVGISVVSALKAVFEAIGTLIATQANVIFQILTGNFSGVKDAFEQGFADIGSIIETSARTINTAWSENEQKRVNTTNAANQQIVQSEVKTAAQIKREREKAAREAERIERLRATRTQQISSNLFGAVKALAGENAGAQKGIAIGQATIDGILAVQKTLAQGGALALPLAFSIGALTAANVAKIAGTPVGFQEGGIVPGSSFTGDRVLAGLNSQEVVLTAANTDNLANQLQAGSRPVNFSAEIDGQALLNFIGDASRDGRLAISSGSIV